MTNHSYKGLTQPLQIDTANPRPARHRVLGATTVTTVLGATTITTVTAPVHYPAAARTKTSSISVQLLLSCC